MENIAELYNLKKHFEIRAGILKRVVGHVKAVDGITFNIPKGKTLGLVGESGCGKTTVGRTIVGLYKPTEGEMFFDVSRENIDRMNDLQNRYNGFSDIKSPEAREVFAELEALRKANDIYRLSKGDLLKKRKELQMVFQDPYGSLNPRIPVGDIIGEGLDIHKLYKTKEERKGIIQNLMDITGIDPAYINRYAHEFSGGQRQRIGIARALSLNPKLIVLDEPVSALDVSIQVQILELLNKLKSDFNLTYMFIAHDLSVVEYFADNVAVMYLGKIVEIADRDSLYKDKLHPYTQALISAVPLPVPNSNRKRIMLEGDVPSPINPPSGCSFHPRCKYKMDICTRETPELKEVKPGHKCACWLHEKG
ncbi:MAG: ATP-binding cassette domain-containing protein [Spirochaetales bacterium]|nr:ATP-binding cassette domain-containing protein [Spirochaetales bacterium]